MPLLILEWIKSNWRGIAIALLLAIIYGKGYYDGYQREKTALDAFVQATEQQAIAAEEHNKLVQKQQEQINKDLKESYDAETKKLHDYYRTHPRTIRLCNDPASSGVSETGKATTGTSEAAEGTTQATTLDLEAAGSEVIQCQKLIEWVEKQGKVE